MALSMALSLSVKFPKSEEWFIIHNETSLHLKHWFQATFVVIFRQFLL